MFRLEEEAQGRLRVTGCLRGAPALRLLAEAIARGAVVVDVSGVLQADEDAVRLLAGLRTDRFTIASPPSWLARWIRRTREAGEAPERTRVVTRDPPGDD